MTEFEQSILLEIAALEEGEVVSYGNIARRAGRPGAARAVGRFLACTQLELPWWRVVRSDGSLAANSAVEQKQRLIEEDVRFQSGRVHCSPAGDFTTP